MTFIHRFRAPFKYNKDHQDGYYDNAIVLVRRFDYERYYHVHEGDNSGEELVARYEWKVVIDFWFLLVRFDWIGRETKKVRELKRAKAQVQEKG